MRVNFTDNFEEWCVRQTASLLDFSLGSICAEGGFGWLDERGIVDRSQGRHMWINARMTHVAAIGALLGHRGCNEALEWGVSALSTIFFDDRHGGWYNSLDWDGAPSDDTKAAYSHSFAILAGASAVGAGMTSALPLLRQALETSLDHFWEESAAMVVEEWDRGFTTLSPYRGVNANMHTVEAYLAAADVLETLDPLDTEPARWRARALAILERVVDREARANHWRIPEHFDADWNRLLEYHRDQASDRFRPYGATIGHALEWARLCLQARASLSDPPDWLSGAAKALYDQALADGWAVDDQDGFIYTTDWQGRVVVHERMHWVAAEAIGASVALGKAGLADTADDVRRWWEYVEAHLIDHRHGSWHHELDRNNQPSATVWSGKPDIYHAIQATLFQRLPLAPALVPALAKGVGG